MTEPQQSSEPPLGPELAAALDKLRAQRARFDAQAKSLAPEASDALSDWNQAVPSSQDPHQPAGPEAASSWGVPAPTLDQSRGQVPVSRSQARQIDDQLRAARHNVRPSLDRPDPPPPGPPYPVASLQFRPPAPPPPPPRAPMPEPSPRVPPPVGQPTGQTGTGDQTGGYDAWSDQAPGAHPWEKPHPTVFGTGPQTGSIPIIARLAEAEAAAAAPPARPAPERWPNSAVPARPEPTSPTSPDLGQTDSMRVWTASQDTVRLGQGEAPSNGFESHAPGATPAAAPPPVAQSAWQAVPNVAPPPIPETAADQWAAAPLEPDLDQPTAVIGAALTGFEPPATGFDQGSEPAAPPDPAFGSATAAPDQWESAEWAAVQFGVEELAEDMAAERWPAEPVVEPAIGPEPPIQPPPTGPSTRSRLQESPAEILARIKAQSDQAAQETTSYIPAQSEDEVDEETWGTASDTELQWGVPSTELPVIREPILGTENEPEAEAEAEAEAPELDPDVNFEPPPEIGEDGQAPWVDGPDAPRGSAPSFFGRRLVVTLLSAVALAAIATLVIWFVL